MKTDKRISENYQTYAFKVSYPQLFETKADLNGAPKYSLTMLFPKAETVARFKKEKHPAADYMGETSCKLLHAVAVKIAKANFGPEVDLSTLKILTIRDGDKPNAKGEMIESNAGYWIVKATTGEKNKPGVVDQNRVKVSDPSDVYAGCWARAVLNIASYSQPSRGVTAYLVGIQKIADDAPLSSRVRVEDMFDNVTSGGSVAPEVADDKKSNPWD